MASRFWVGDSGNWSSTGHWSATSGGASGASVPINTTDVFFDVNSFTSTGQTVTMDAATGNAQNIDFTGVLNDPIFVIGSAKVLLIRQNITLATNMTFGDGNGLLQMTTNGIASHIKSNSTVFDILSFTINDTQGYLDDEFVMTGGFAVINSAATFNTQNYNFTAGSATFDNQTSLGASIITLNPTAATVDGIVFSSSMNPLLFNAGTSTININLTAASTPNYFFTSSTTDLTLYNLNITGDNSPTVLSFSLPGFPAVAVGDLTMNNMTIDGEPIEIDFHDGNNYIANTFNANGASGDLITFRSTTGGNTYTNSSNHTSFSYVDVQDSIAGGLSVPFQDSTGGVDSGNNTNWVFRIPRQYNAGTEGKLIIAPPRGTINNPVLDASAITGTRIYTFQDADGTVAFLSDITGGTPGGADTNVQFNDSNAFGGDSKFAFNKTSGFLTLQGGLAVNDLTNVIGVIFDLDPSGDSGNGLNSIRSDAKLRLESTGSGIELVLASGKNLNVTNLPTSAAGLSTGDIWIDTTGGLNILKIV